MARYIDADKLAKTYMLKGKDKLRLATVINELEMASTADVVPQSEVEQLKRNLEQCENGYRQQIHLLQCKFADEKRVIFEELQRNMACNFDIVTLDVCTYEIEAETFAKIKKKFTGGEDNEN